MKTQVHSIDSLQRGRIMRLLMSSVFLVFLFLEIKAQVPNQQLEITTADGMGNNGCSAVLKASNGELWVTHLGYSPVVSYNSARPISKRDAQGNWSFPDLSLAPSVTNNNQTYNINAHYTFDKIYEQSNGNIWFLPKFSGNVPTSMGFAPPVVMYDGNNWNTYHSARGNFPDAGGVLDMVEAPNGDLWFGCASGLVSMSLAGVTNSYNPPAVADGNQNRQADNVISVDINNAGNVVMVASDQNTPNGGGFFGWACVREFDENTNTWSNWHLNDANWTNAAQNYYQPKKVVAMRDAIDRLYVTTAGGGLYFIDNGNFASKDPNHIASFHQGWSHPGVNFDNVITNLTDWTADPYRSERGRFWVTTGAASGASQNSAYRFEAKRPTTWNGVPGAASYYAFARKKAQFSTVSSGQTYRANINDLDFGANDTEVWFATEQGLEVWYADYPNPNADFIGIEGAGAENAGVVGFNTHTLGNMEPANSGHQVPVGTPTISIDTAYYYIASSDYDNLNQAVNAGLEGDGTAQGFANTAAALLSQGLDWDDIQLKFTPIDLGSDIRGDEWDYGSYLETREYQKRVEIIDDTVAVASSHYTIMLNGFPLFKGEMPLVNMGIRYNKYGYLLDSIAGVSDFVALDTTEWIDDLCDCLPNAQARTVAEALLQDVGNFGVRFNFRSIESANQMDLNDPGRTGGFFNITKAMIEKGTVAMANGGPMSGIIRVGPSPQAEYAQLEEAIRDFKRRGASSWVQFRIEPGTYEGIFDFSNIPGLVGFNNREVTLISHTGDSSDVVVRKKPGRRDTNYVFKMNQEIDMNLRLITIENHTNVDSSRIIYVESALNSLDIHGCMIRGTEDTVTNEEASLIFMDGPVRYMNISGSIFDGGWNAIHYKSLNLATIQNNLFVDQQGFAVYAEDHDEGEIRDNRFEGPSVGRFSGIYAGDVDHSLLIEANRFINRNVPATEIIHMSSNADPGSFNNDKGVLILNNEISVLGDDQTSAVMLAGDYTKFYHNNIYMAGTDTTACALKTNFIWDDVRLDNNVVETENGRIMEHQSWGGQFGAQLNNNVYFSGNARPFSLDLGNNNGIVYLSEVDSLFGRIGTDQNSMWLDPQYSSADFLLPTNPAAHDTAPLLAEVSLDLLGDNRPAVDRDHGCYEYVSAVNNLPCIGDITVSAQRLDNFFIRINWTDAGVNRYRLYFRVQGAPNWRQMQLSDTTKVIGPLNLNTYEFYVTDRNNTLQSCEEQIVMDCVDFTYSTVVTQIKNVQNKGAIRVFGMDAGKRNWDIGLDNGTDTTWINNRRAGAFSRLESGTYMIHVRDRYGCYSSQVDTIVINAIDTTVIPVLTNLQRIGNNTLRPIWTVQNSNNIDRYQVRVKDITGGAPGVLYNTYIVQGGNATQFDIANLPVGTFAVDVRARVNGTFQNSIYSRPKSKIIFQNKNGEKGDSDLMLEQVTSIYPNPASDKVIIRSKAGSTIQLLDMNGRILDEQELTNEQVNLSVQSYAPGVYLIRVFTGSETYTERLIKR